MIIIHAVMQVNPAFKEKFLAEAKQLLAATHTEEGNLSYELYNHIEQDNTYIMVETWRDMEAVASHNTSAHFTGFAAKAPEFLTAPLDVKVFTGEPAGK
ncbi:putative quinol monooxygenase [Paenibacillus sp. sgz5001063]|uniref:putative quinol monooxygenase n=1 Tax=Paenibacillus sp. sgz5001063 TaxID=3242474 RepID=UPI0036D3BD0E